VSVADMAEFELHNMPNSDGCDISTWVAESPCQNEGRVLSATFIVSIKWSSLNGKHHNASVLPSSRTYFQSSPTSLALHVRPPTPTSLLLVLYWRPCCNGFLEDEGKERFNRI